MTHHPASPSLDSIASLDSLASLDADGLVASGLPAVSSPSLSALIKPPPKRKSLLPHPLRRSFPVLTPFPAALALILALALALATSRLLAPPQTPLLAPFRSFVAVSADDFGRFADAVPLQPDAAFIASHPSLSGPAGRWYARASIETSSDLTALATSLRALNTNTSHAQRVVVTPHFVVGGPDFRAMAAAGCARGPLLPGACAYRERLLSSTRLPGTAAAPFLRADLRPLYHSLFREGLWHPEYHGRSHFNVPAWVGALRAGDKRALDCFEAGLVCAGDGASLRSEFNGFASAPEMADWLSGGVDAFADFFGYRPLLMSSPHNVWSAWLVDAARGLGFVGAELAEDQEAYIPATPSFSLHDRFRFDVFFPNFHCETAVDEVVDLLTVPGPKTVRHRWYDLLSRVDLFHTHYAPLHHSRGGNHERFLSLMWHAQNAMSSTYAPEQHAAHIACLGSAVRAIRTRLPRTVFVTGAELHQIRSRGWSAETWHDAAVLRNYLTTPIDVTVPSSVTGLARVEVLSDGAEEKAGLLPATARAGDVLSLPADTALRISSGH